MEKSLLSMISGRRSLPDGLKASLKFRVKAVLLQLDTIQSYETEKKSANVQVKPTLLEASKQFFLQSTKAKQHMIQFKPISELIQKAKLPTELLTVQQLMLTWLDSDFLNICNEQLVVLVISLILAIEWLDINCSHPRVRGKSEQMIQELLFLLIPHLEDSVPLVKTLFLLQCVVPMEIVEEEMEKLKIEQHAQLLEEQKHLPQLHEHDNDDEPEQQPTNVKQSSNKSNRRRR